MTVHAPDIVRTPPNDLRPPEAPGPRPLALTVVDSDRDFDALEHDWNALMETSEATVYQSFEWQRAWWKYFGRGRSLRILVFSDGGAVAGIVPLFLERERLFGVPVARRLQFIGAGLSDYLSVLASRGRERRVLEALAGWLAERRGGWDVFDLEDVAETSPSFELLQGALAAGGLRIYRYQGSVCPRITLPESEEALIRQLGSSSGYNLKRKMKRLHVNFRSTVRLIRRPGPQLTEAIAEFAAIHGERWRSQGHPSAFDDPHHLAFHEEVCQRLAARNWLRIFFLDIERRPVAVSFSFNFRSTIYMYQSNAFASEEIMRCSPGLLVRYTAMTDGIREGMTVFDFMRGNESYKYREWHAADVRNWLLRSSSPSAAGALRFTLFLLAEFVGKAGSRLRFELYEYRRYRLSGQDDDVSPPVYAMTKLTRLAELAGHFLRRHLPGAGRRRPEGSEAG